MKTLTSKLARISALCREVIALDNEASAGPWKRSNGTDVRMATGARTIVAECAGDGCTSVCPNSNAAFIAATRTLTPALARVTLAVIEKLRYRGNALSKDAVETLQAIADAFSGEDLGECA